MWCGVTAITGPLLLRVSHHIEMPPEGQATQLKIKMWDLLRKFAYPTTFIFYRCHLSDSHLIHYKLMVSCLSPLGLPNSTNCNLNTKWYIYYRVHAKVPFGKNMLRNKCATALLWLLILSRPMLDIKPLKTVCIILFLFIFTRMVIILYKN